MLNVPVEAWLVGTMMMGGIHVETVSGCGQVDGMDKLRDGKTDSTNLI